MRAINRTRISWAALAGVGAAYIATGLALTVISPVLEWLINLDQLLNHVTFPPPPTGLGMAAAWSLAIAVGAFAATYVATAANGPRAAGLYASLLALTALIRIGWAIKEQREAIPSFTIVAVSNVPEATAATFLAPAIGLAAGWALGRRARTGHDGSNASLEAAALYALSGAAAFAVVTLLTLPFPYVDLLSAPYWIGAVPTGQHGTIVVAQSVVAAFVYAVRSPAAGSLIRSAFVFSLFGVVAALPQDIQPILFTLFLDWTSLPLSLVLVPLASALIGVLTVAVVSRVRAPRIERRAA